MRAPSFRQGQVVTWVDPDEDGVMKPHVGRVVSWEVQDDARVYFIHETEDLFALVLEEELSPVKMED